MFPIYLHSPADDFSPLGQGRGTYRSPNRMDVERNRREFQRMSYLTTDPELHAKYVIDQHMRDAMLAERRRAARGGQAPDSMIMRLRRAIGSSLIVLGQRIAPPARSRAVVPYTPRPSKGTP